ncbi:MAG: hypothetical protein H7Y20_09250 [Bryobacteraceae bacterium]|nr:hypothetical protein [Bryobacteraceae bacterium]
MLTLRRLTGTVLAVLTCILADGCRSPSPQFQPAIAFTKLPPSGHGSPDRIHDIGGRVTHAGSGQRIVLFARSGIWWVQPTAEQPFTAIKPDSSWQSSTHPGSAYAALLVTPEYRPPATVSRLPDKGGAVLATVVAEQAQLSKAAGKMINFSGYEWELREVTSDRSGTMNLYSAANAWTDQKGFLHLRIAKSKEEWTSAEVRLSRSLGYGSYRFVVRDVSHLEPAAVFSILAWDDTGPLEMDIEVSRWGEPETKNSQYVIQPYYVPANVFRFNTPPGIVTYSFRWDLGKASFRTDAGARPRARAVPIAEHVFTSGVPSPGNESIHMNLYVYGNKRNPLKNGSEVIIENFEYLP